MQTILNYLEPLKNISFWHNSVFDYVIAVVVFIGLLIILKLIQLLMVRFFRGAAKKTKTEFDDTLINIFLKIKPPFYFIVGIYLGIKKLFLPNWLDRAILILFILIITYELIRIVGELVDYAIKKYSDKKGGDSKISNSLVGFIKLGIKAILWLFAISIILSNFGFNVTSLIAGLGIGGIAVALALQNILSDLFSSFSIYFDKPFSEGDFIVAGSEKGTVKKVGLKSTRIKSVDGEEIIIPNKDLTGARLQNFQKMKKRRDLFQVGVVYGTHPDKLERIPKIIEKIFADIGLADFERCHFKQYADSSLNFEIVYFVKSKEYPVYLDVKQQINLAIYKAFKEENIAFAYPTQTLFVNKD